MRAVTWPAEAPGRGAPAHAAATRGPGLRGVHERGAVWAAPPPPSRHTYPKGGACVRRRQEWGDGFGAGAGAARGRRAGRDLGKRFLVVQAAGGE